MVGHSPHCDGLPRDVDHVMNSCAGDVEDTTGDKIAEELHARLRGAVDGCTGVRPTATGTYSLMIWMP